MADLNSSDRYEILAELYRRQFGELAPGKDRSPLAGIQSDEERIENNERWSEWLTHRFNHPLERALEKIHCMQDQAEQREEALRDASDAKAELRARIAQLQEGLNAQQLANEGLNTANERLTAENARLQAESKQHLEWATTWHDALCVVATVLEVPTADSAQAVKTGIVECIRDLTAENAGLREDRERLDWMELKGWVPDYSEVNETIPTRTLRACIDAARGAK